VGRPGSNSAWNTVERRSVQPSPNLIGDSCGREEENAHSQVQIPGEIRGFKFEKGLLEMCMGVQSVAELSPMQQEGVGEW
jgi:hypothetical protein